MSWDEGFAEHYDEWSAGMTGDVGFCVELARQADGPLVELAEPAALIYCPFRALLHLPSWAVPVRVREGAPRPRRPGAGAV